MWHEARRREKATQKLFNDHKKRASKRREENKVDPSTLLQVHGLKSKINLDPNTHVLAGRSMVVWQGDQKTTIDRFDVRATLSSIPTEDKTSTSTSRIVAARSSATDEARRKFTVFDINESESMKKLLNYERYRLLIQNDLNQVPEERRLSLVIRSESLSKAKIRKLEKNYFGTSGEAALSNEQYTMTTSQFGRSNHLQSKLQSQTKPQTVAIGFSYGSVQPPMNGGYDEVDSEPPAPSRINNLLNDIVDLDDYEDFDLDCVDKRFGGSKVIDATLRKYGLNCTQLNLLIDTADDKTTCFSAKDIIRKLALLREKSRQERISEPEHDFYGPTLPPELKPENDDSPDDGDEKPVGQRSPRAADLPDEKVDSRSATGSPEPVKNGPIYNEQDLEQIPMPSGDPESPLSQTNSPKLTKTNYDRNFSLKDLIQNELSKASLEPTSAPPKPCVNRNASPEPQESRRASTPLAYKRYRRSSRSLSRERLRNRSSPWSDSTSSSSSGSSSSSSCSSSSTSSRSGSSSRSSTSSTVSSRDKGRVGRGSSGRSGTYHKRSRSPAHKHRGNLTRRKESRDHRQARTRRRR